MLTLLTLFTQRHICMYGMDGWIDCCYYWSTAFQIHSADNDDDDGADSIVRVKGSTEFFFVFLGIFP